MSSFGRYILKNCRIYLVHPETLLSSLILELQGTKLDKTWIQESSQHKEQVSKEVFPNLKISLLILDELKNLGFEGNGRDPPNRRG
jgi:hypothetical protein